MAKEDKQSAKARRAALEKQLADQAKGKAQKSEAPKAKGDKGGAPKDKAAKAPRIKSSGGLGKKLAMIVGGLLLLLIVSAGIVYLSIGGSYDHDELNLVPKDALLVIVIEEPSSQLESLEGALGEVYQDRSSFGKFEKSPLWRETSETSLSKIHQEQVKAGIADMRTTLKQFPTEVTLEEDFLTGKLVIALVANAKGDSTESVILTRVSSGLSKMWAFSGFAEGTQGTTTIASEGDYLAIAKAGETTRIALFGDVMAISSSAAALDKVKARYTADDAGGFPTLKLFGKANEQLAASELSGPSIKAYANLEAIREYQEPDPQDPQGRDPIDTYFSPSAQTMQMSAEIMPTVANVLEHSIDTRMYGMAAWKCQLTPNEGIQIDQFLVAEEGKIEDFPKVKAALSTEAADTDFLDLLPQGTWMVATMRQPMSEIRKATPPPQPGQTSTIHSFMKELANEAGEPESIGLAMLPQRFAPRTYAGRSDLRDNEGDTRNLEAMVPPDVVSKLRFPPFALFLKWEGVRHEQVALLLQTVVDKVAAEQKDPNNPNEKPVTKVVSQRVNGLNYSMIFNGPKQNLATVGWLNNIAAVALDDYLIFTYAALEGRRPAMQPNGQNSAVEYITGISQQLEGYTPLSTKERALATKLGREHNAFVHFASHGLQSYANNVGLATDLARNKFDAEAPDGKSIKEWRTEVAKELGLEYASPELTKVLQRRLLEWRRGEIAYQRDTQENITALSVVKDFTALTKTTPEVMHTRFLLRLGK